MRGRRHAAKIGRTAATFGLVCVPLSSLRCPFGAVMSRFPADGQRRRMFDGAMATLNVVPVPSVLFQPYRVE